MSRLTQVRLQSGLTQQALANRAGLALNTIVKLEAGRADPRLRTARCIAAALNSSVEELWPPESPRAKDPV